MGNSRSRSRIARQANELRADDAEDRGYAARREQAIADSGWHEGASPITGDTAKGRPPGEPSVHSYAWLATDMRKIVHCHFATGGAHSTMTTKKAEAHHDSNNGQKP